ncbi:MAG: class II aldolase/adducin family protein [Betaproteobacteria bacterium]|nr:class II aldolase/adducin family protein [Betaproteobacteria bacterium]
MSAVLKPSTSLRDRVSKEEWDVRVNLAAAYQVAAQFKWTDWIFTHFSARVPGPEHHFLINPFGLMFEEITASTLLKIDQEGNVIEDPVGLGYNKAGFVIHGCIHAARPEAQCVIHTHTRAGVAVAATKEGLLPLSQHSLRVISELTYHDYEGVALDLDERVRMTANLGKTSRAMMLRNHGLLTLGDSVREAFEIMYYLECACQIQVDALAGGREHVTLIPQEVIDRGEKQFNRPGRESVGKDWAALLRMLDRRGIQYKD